MTRSLRERAKVLAGSAVVLLAVTALWAQTKGTAPPQRAPQLPPIPAAISSISASDLKGDLSFLASDALGGRYTPSPGLDVAAEFVASQFRAAGLEPGGDQEYFQTAQMVDRQMPKPSSEMTVQEGSQSFTIPAQSITIFNANEAAQIQRCPVLVFKAKDPDVLKGVDLSGKTIVAPEPFSTPVPAEQREEVFCRSHAFDEVVNASHAKIEILVGRPRRGSRPRLLSVDQIKNSDVLIVIADSDRLKKW